MECVPSQIVWEAVMARVSLQAINSDPLTLHVGTALCPQGSVTVAHPNLCDRF